MHKFPAIAGALALLFAPAHAGAHTSRTSAEKQVVAKIVYERKMTWRWQDRAHHKRSLTSHRERRAALPVLHRLAHYWEHRHYLAWSNWYSARSTQRAAASTQTVSVDSCLSTLIGREGGMNPMRWNGGYVGIWDGGTHGGSGAYGIPQALPGSKMASAGSDWATNPATQIRWMISYVNERYGGSCSALAHSYSYGWY